MPLPAGYTLDNASAGPPTGYTVDQSYTPGPARGASGESTPDHGSVIGDFIRNSPVGAVQSLAAAIRDPKSAVTGMLKSTGDILQEAKDSYHAGNYGAAAVHFLNYALSPLGGAAMDAAGNDFAEGRWGHGLAKTAGIATTAAVLPKTPEIAASAAETLPKIPGAIAAGARAGTPDVLAGAGKVAAGEALAKLPGMEFPARIGMGYPGARQIAKGMEKGGAAFKAALQAKVQAAAKAVTAEAPAEVAQTAQPLEEINPQMARQVGEKPAAAPQATAADPEVLDGLAKALANKPYARLKSDEKLAVDRIAGAGTTKPAPANVLPPEQAEAMLSEMNGQPRAETPAPPNVSRATSAKLTPDQIAAQLRDELVKNGMPVNLAVGAPGEAAAPSVAEVSEAMRGMPAGAARAVADANYAGNQEPGTASAVYEAAGRAEKATKFAKALHDNGISYAELAAHKADDLSALLAPVAKGLKINAPSKATIGEILFRMQRLENGKP